MYSYMLSWSDADRQKLHKINGDVMSAEVIVSIAPSSCCVACKHWSDLAGEEWEIWTG